MIAWLARLLSGVFTLKMFMGGLFMTILAISGYNLVVEIVAEVLEFSLGQMSTIEGGTAPTASITGFAGWFLSCLKVPEMFSVIVTFVSMKFILRKIPFLRW